MTVEEAEHMMATKLYQNNAKVHFNHFVEKGGRFGKRIVYGGHVISLTRALSFNGLSNAFKIIAINGGTTHHRVLLEQCFCLELILDKVEVSESLGAIRSEQMELVMHRLISFNSKIVTSALSVRFVKS